MYTKTQANMKVLKKAQLALEKHTVDDSSLDDKDWADIIRWVLPEAKVTSPLRT